MGNQKLVVRSNFSLSHNVFSTALARQNVVMGYHIIPMTVKFICLGFYVVLAVFQLFNGDSSQTHVSGTIFYQYFTSPLSGHWRVSRNAIPIILSAKMTVEKKPFEKIVEKGENAGNQHFLLFRQCVLPIPPKTFSFYLAFTFLSANAFNAYQCKILLFSNQLFLHLPYNFLSFQSQFNPLIHRYSF